MKGDWLSGFLSQLNHSYPSRQEMGWLLVCTDNVTRLTHCSLVSELGAWVHIWGSYTLSCGFGQDSGPQINAQNGNDVDSLPSIGREWLVWNSTDVNVFVQSCGGSTVKELVDFLMFSSLVLQKGLGNNLRRSLTKKLASIRINLSFLKSTLNPFTLCISMYQFFLGDKLLLIILWEVIFAYVQS